MVDIQQALELRAQGTTFKIIAQKLGCSEGYLRTKLVGVRKGTPVQSLTDRLINVSKELAAIARQLET